MKLKKALALMLILWLVMPNLTGLAETGDPDAEITADPAQDEVPEADEMSLGDADDAPDAADGAESPP